MKRNTVDVFIWASIASLVLGVVAFFVGADTLPMKIAVIAFLIASAVIDRLDKIITELAQARNDRLCAQLKRSAGPPNA